MVCFVVVEGGVEVQRMGVSAKWTVFFRRGVNLGDGVVMVGNWRIRSGIGWGERRPER